LLPQGPIWQTRIAERLSQIHGITLLIFTEHNMGALGPTFDPAKRDKTLAERGLAFEDAALVFAGVTLDVQDTRAKAHRALP